MKLGLICGYSGAEVSLDMNLILEAEKLGFDSIWTAESYGSDAISPLAWIGALTSRIKLGTAIMQMPARTPAATAMTAMTLDGLSGGRFLLGIGPSGPQVIEGWYGVPYGRPLMRTREYIAIIRKILDREEPLMHRGEHYQIPFDGTGASGLGKPMKSAMRGRKTMKIYTASISPKGIELSGEIADGLIPAWMNPERLDLYQPHLTAGFAKAGMSKSMSNFDLAPFVTCAMGELEATRMPIKALLGFYIGGMGARNKNFYNDYVKRMGYEEAAEKIQELYLDGKRNEAVAAVPDSLVDEVALFGSKERIAERLQAWKSSPVGTMLISTKQVEVLRLLAELLL